MSLTISAINENVIDFIRQQANESAALQALREATQQLPQAQMMSSPEQAQYLAWLVELIGARRVIEVGVFTGYATLAMAEALPDDGRIIACDINRDTINIGQPFWQQANVEHKIDVCIAPAADTLAALIKEKQTAFDFAFVDADKESYANYYELLLKLLRPNGVIVFDNILFAGKQVIIEQASKMAQSLYQFTLQLLQDKRVACTIVPLGGGMLIARVT